MRLRSRLLFLCTLVLASNPVIAQQAGKYSCEQVEMSTGIFIGLEYMTYTCHMYRLTEAGERWREYLKETKSCINENRWLASMKKARDFSPGRWAGVSPRDKGALNVAQCGAMHDWLNRLVSRSLKAESFVERNPNY